MPAADAVWKPPRTLERFRQILARTPKKEEIPVGAWWTGHSRAVFCFAGQWLYLESAGSYSDRLARSIANGTPAQRDIPLCRRFEPSDRWWTDFHIVGKKLAKKIARAFGGDVTEAPYAPDDSWCLTFPDFESMSLFVWTRYTGELQRKFGVGGPAYRKGIPVEREQEN